MSLEAKIEKKKRTRRQVVLVLLKGTYKSDLGSTSALFSSCSMAKAKQNI